MGYYIFLPIFPAASSYVALNSKHNGQIKFRALA